MIRIMRIIRIRQLFSRRIIGAECSATGIQISDIFKNHCEFLVQTGRRVTHKKRGCTQMRIRIFGLVPHRTCCLHKQHGILWEKERFSQIERNSFVSSRLTIATVVEYFAKRYRRYCFFPGVAVKKNTL